MKNDIETLESPFFTKQHIRSVLLQDVWLQRIPSPPPIKTWGSSVYLFFMFSLFSLSLYQCDGNPLALPQLEGIAVVNIPSVYGGANLWGETDKKKAKKSRAKSGVRSNDLEWAVQGMFSQHIAAQQFSNDCQR